MMDPVRTLAACRYVQATRRLRRPGSPAELARALDPTFVVTPTIRLLSDIAVRSVLEPDQRDIVNTPPRTGKSQGLAIWLPVWALMINPDMQIMVVSHADDLAQEHSRKARELIKEHAEFLGYRLAQDKTAVGRWRVEGRAGGMLATGINSGVVGFGADLMVIDDPVKDAAQADSKAHRDRVLKEYQGSLATRVHPGGSVLLVQTRWHEQDLAGSLMKLEPGRWRRTNIPAVSERKIPDALGRPPGVTMISALGYTADDYVSLRRTVGERVWYAQYEGEPSSPEGGLVKREWLDTHRLAAAPPSPVLTVVAVDPSDSGSGDACGIVAVSLTADRRVAMIADKSAPMTSDAWARAAVDLAIEVGASEIAVESFAARETYQRVVKDALARVKLSRPVRVSAWPPKGSGRGGGDAIARSSALLQGLEVGTCRLAGQFPRFEERAVAWQAGQHQPDGLAALVVGHDVLVHAAGGQWHLAPPLSGSLTDGVGRAQTVGSDVRGGAVTSMDDWMRRRVG